jgi:hypothetical protein
MKKTLLLLVMVFTALSGIAQKKKNQKTPGWIDDPYGGTYKEDDYLLGVGSGDTQQAAQNSAFGNISRIFQAEVKAEQSLMESMRETQKNGGPIASDRSSELVNMTRIGSNAKLINTQVLETFQKDGTYYALAGMRRRETGKIYSDEINTNLEKIQALENAAGSETNNLQKLRLLRSALTLLSVNENLAKQRAIILRGKSANDGPETYNRISEAYRNHQKVCVVRVQSDGAAKSIVDAVSKIFTDFGFSVSETERPIIEAVVTFKAEEVQMGQPNVFGAKWLLTIQMKDNETNRQVQGFSTEGRDAKIGSYEAAVIQADFTARKKIESEFKKYLDKEFLSSN